MIDGYRECDHVAPVHGVPTVFASVEFTEGEPPESIVIAGVRYVREGCDDNDGLEGRLLARAL